MENKTLLLIFITSILAIILTSCGGVKINTQVLVQDSNYSFTTDSGTYTYQVVLEPRKGSISATILGMTTKDSKLVVYRENLPPPQETPVTPGISPKPITTKIQSFEIKSGAKYSQEDSPDGGKSTFEIAIDITTDPNSEVNDSAYLVDFKVKKQT